MINRLSQVRNAALVAMLGLCALALAAPSRGGWVYVRLEGSPTQIGYQYGSKLAPEIDTRNGFVAPFPDFTPGGSVQGKVTTSDLVNHMSFWARLGHPCGAEFLVTPFLAQHPEFNWELPFLHDMKSHPWTLFASK